MDTFFCFCSPLTLPARFRIESRRTSVGELVLLDDVGKSDVLLELTIIIESKRTRTERRTVECKE